MAKGFTTAIHSSLKKEGKLPHVTKGVEIDYTAPDWILLENLEESAYRFSAAKSWSINRALTSLLNQDNNKSSWNQFEKAAAKELHVYLGDYGHIEYNTALSSSQMAAKELRFQENKHAMPWIQFKTSKGEHVCPICGPYDNVIKHIDDPMWDYASPLLHYQCQCTKVQLPSSKATPTPDKDLPDPDLIPPIFRNAFCRKGEAFPPEHPYYKEADKKSLNQWVKENYPKNT